VAGCDRDRPGGAGVGEHEHRPPAVLARPARTGQQVRFWIDTVTVHLSIDGWRIKTVPSRLSGVDIARLRHPAVPHAARPAAQAARPSAGPQPLPSASPVIQRKVSSRGGIQVARQPIQVALPHAERIVTIELGDTTLRSPVRKAGCSPPCPGPATARLPGSRPTAARPPLRLRDRSLASGPERSPEGGGFAAAHYPARAAQATGPLRPIRVLRIALRATALRAALDPGDLMGPLAAGRAGRPVCLRPARGAQTPRWQSRRTSRGAGPAPVPKRCSNVSAISCTRPSAMPVCCSTASG
jgi:hypothetical protein